MGIVVMRDVNMTVEEQEQLCKHCGRCCREKLKINGDICLFMNSPCPYLGLDEKGYYVEKGKYFCSIYEDRFNIGKYDVVCLKLEQAIKDEILPEGCGYQSLFPKDYKYPREINSLNDLHYNI
jgi:uncharacterized cysteine cluster protein YcgN (CxxCxxCC family)